MSLVSLFASRPVEKVGNTHANRAAVKQSRLVKPVVSDDNNHPPFWPGLWQSLVNLFVSRPLSAEPDQGRVSKGPKLVESLASDNPPSEDADVYPPFWPGLWQSLVSLFASHPLNADPDHQRVAQKPEKTMPETSVARSGESLLKGLKDSLISLFVTRRT